MPRSEQRFIANRLELHCDCTVEERVLTLLCELRICHRSRAQTERQDNDSFILGSTGLHLEMAFRGQSRAPTVTNCCLFRSLTQRIEYQRDGSCRLFDIGPDSPPVAARSSLAGGRTSRSLVFLQPDIQSSHRPLAQRHTPAADGLQDGDRSAPCLNSGDVRQDDSLYLLAAATDITGVNPLGPERRI
jgi:hypothetical protein